MDILCIFTFNYSTPRDKLNTVLPTALRGICINDHDCFGFSSMSRSPTVYSALHNSQPSNPITGYTTIGGKGRIEYEQQGVPSKENMLTESRCQAATVNSIWVLPSITHLHWVD